MTQNAPRKIYPRWRIHFRRARISCLCVILAAVLALFWLNQIGLPGFLKGPLLRNLSTRGVDLQFTRLRWRFVRGFVADNVILGPPKPDADAPQFSAQEIAIKLNHNALLHGTVKVDSLIITRGQLVWQLEQTNQPTETLLVSDLQTQLRFLPNDQWDLDNFSAAFAGARMWLSGSLANASALREWMSRPRSGPSLLQQHLHALAKTVRQITFDKMPELNVIIRGDARDPQSFNGIVTLDAPGAQTPWGKLTEGSLLARLIPPNATNATPRAECRLRAGQVDSRWVSLKHFQLDLHARGDDAVTNLVRARLEMSAAQFVTRWAQATNAQFTAAWTHSLTNAVPLAGKGELRLGDARTRWGATDQLRLNASLSANPNQGPPVADASWGWWAGLEPYALDWNCHLENIHAGDFKSQELFFQGNWQAPQLTITNLHTEMYQGQFDAHAVLNVASRVASFSCDSDFDVQKATPLLTPGGQEWFKQQEFTWENPPAAHASGSLVLPPWTNRPPDWKNDIKPTLQLQGNFKVGAASFHQVPIMSAQSHFTYSNMIWNLPDLVATRPEGTVEIAHVSNDRTKDYYFHIHSAVAINPFHQLLPASARQVLDEIVFSQPPVIDAELWGTWRIYERIGAKARITMSNFSYRGESATYLRATLQYTNRFLTVTDTRIERTTNMIATASGAGFDFYAKKGYLTNGFSTMPPKAILTCLGPKTARHVEPYIFLRPPTVQASGVIPLSDDTSVADLHFIVEGGPFQWLKFHSPHVAGKVDWVGKDLNLSQIMADFYGGKLSGASAFDFRPKEGANFHFDITTSDTDLHALMSDLTIATNHLEGKLTGHLNITHANTDDPKSWSGNGDLRLRDGLIWEIPIFGVFSGVLDSFSKGLGTARISSASANLSITNSLIHSDNLDLRSSTVRLLYRGTVDFNLKVDAKVDAYISRDVPVVGSVLNFFTSPFSRLFETRVTGTITDPKYEPLLVGKVISTVIHPWRMFMPGDTGTGADAPPVWPTSPP